MHFLIIIKLIGMLSYLLDCLSPVAAFGRLGLCQFSFSFAYYHLGLFDPGILGSIDMYKNDGGKK